jgi:hypothetical protein
VAAVAATFVAARNNAEWCHAFCRTHGILGRFDADAWSSAERTPPFYPDAVTLAPGGEARRILTRVDARAGCSIKDSFGDLDLTAEGFDVLFRAEWLCLERADGGAPSWSVIESEAELAKWEAAWGESPATPTFFRPALLADDSIAILARYEGDGVAAGAVANRSAACIGLSNVFDEGDDLQSVYLGAATAAQHRWGPMPVVGYDSGVACEAAQRAGFLSIGELTVWVRGGGSATA